MATIKDVARVAGVSTTTVSHVLNDTRKVAEATRSRVEQAVAELDYVPNTLARSLKGGSSRVLGMMVTDTNNPFYADLIQWVDQVAYRHGYNLILCNTQGSPERAVDYLEMLTQRRVDGLLLMSSDTEQGHLMALAASTQVPMVVMDSAPAQAGYDRILDDSVLGGQMATNHLIKNGHSRIALLTGPEGQRNSDSRLHGYRQAMAKANLLVEPGWEQHASFSYEGGEAAMESVLAADPTITAVFAGNDLMALGASRALQRAGRRIPDDVSLIGYDDIRPARYGMPPLTTVRQPMEALAGEAIAMLLARMDNPGLPGRQVVLPPELVARESVSPR